MIMIIMINMELGALKHEDLKAKAGSYAATGKVLFLRFAAANSVSMRQTLGNDSRIDLIPLVISK